MEVKRVEEKRTEAVDDIPAPLIPLDLTDPKANLSKKDKRPPGP